MRVVVIGGSGHVGTYMVPMLVETGYEVIELSRGKSNPYLPNSAWNHVKRIQIDRMFEDRAGTFGKFVKNLNPDIVIDMICFNVESAKQLVSELRGRVRHFLSCGTIWVYGHSIEVPATEDQEKCPFGEYGIGKFEIEDYLLKEARINNFPATVLRPGHLVGPGWVPLNPAANFNPEVYGILARGEELKLPNIGMETIHHVHAQDVARLFMLAIENWSNSVGESFNAVSDKALTLRGYAEKMASWFGKTANITYLPWKEWKNTASKEDADSTWEHISHSPNLSIEKAKRLLGYKPHYSSLNALYEAVNWLVEHEVIKL
jgi:nucleoside-diphosphate-sugar epimerase